MSRGLLVWIEKNLAVKGMTNSKKKNRKTDTDERPLSKEDQPLKAGRALERAETIRKLRRSN